MMNSSKASSSQSHRPWLVNAVHSPTVSKLTLSGQEVADCLLAEDSEEMEDRALPRRSPRHTPSKRSRMNSMMSPMMITPPPLQFNMDLLPGRGTGDNNASGLQMVPGTSQSSSGGPLEVEGQAAFHGPRRLMDDLEDVTPLGPAPVSEFTADGTLITRGVLYKEMSEMKVRMVRIEGQLELILQNQRAAAAAAAAAPPPPAAAQAVPEVPARPAVPAPTNGQRSSARHLYSIGNDRENLCWVTDDKLTIDSGVNTAMTQFIRREMLGLYPDMAPLAISKAMESHFATRKKDADLVRTGKKEAENAAARARGRKATKKTKRIEGAKAKHSWNKERRDRVLAVISRPDVQSSEDEGGEVNGRKVFLVRPRPWESQELRDIKAKLDEKRSKLQTKRGAKMMDERRPGPPSTAAVPAALREPALAWAVADGH